MRRMFLLCGERGIRTPEGFDTLLAFQASALDHYAISPNSLYFTLNYGICQNSQKELKCLSKLKFVYDYE